MSEKIYGFDAVEVEISPLAIVTRPFITNPPSEFSMSDDYLRIPTYFERPGFTELVNLVFQRVFWAKPFTSGVDEWAYITVGFQCLNCRLIVFGTRFRDFQHDCATRELK